jgi:coenzyme F420-dependent glucose-6-phosphate dehydrogenase
MCPDQRASVAGKMARFGYHVSHEQFTPADLLRWTKHAEDSGFDCAMSSDHFHPWSERQGQSGFAWSWLGAAMERTAFPFGIISAPGYRYHPAIVAQGAATLAQMYPGRLWLALGSGEAINEAITGLAWPDKQERNARLLECAHIIRALFAGETVTHRGRVTVVEAKLYSRPEHSPMLVGAAVSESTAEWVGSWADALITVQASPEQLGGVVEAFRRGGGEGRPMFLQVALAWAQSEAEAEAEAIHQWGPNAVGGEAQWDLRRPQDFDAVSRFVTADDIRKSVLVSADLGRHRAWLSEYAEIGFAEIYLHQVGRQQLSFIDAFGEHVLPALRQKS